MRETLRKRFEVKVDRSADGCWEWTGFRDKAGYARIREGGRSAPVLYAHRYAYETFVEEIPDGLQIDHLCRNRGCVNPAHMEPVTMAENIRRSDSETHRLHREGRCRRGHDVSPTNTAFRRGTNLVAYCKACRREDRALARDHRETVSAAGH